VAKIPCPVVGCGRPVGFGSRGWARDAAVVEAYLVALDKAGELSHQIVPDLVPFMRVGDTFFKQLHDRAHLRGPVVLPVRKINEWKQAAARACAVVAIGDPEWFCRYWSELRSRGVPLPSGMGEILSGIESAQQS